MKTNSSSFRSIVKNYIISNINAEGYDKKVSTDKEKLQFVYDCFLSEFWYDNNRARYGNNEYNGFSEYLKGLPSCIDIDFENYRILELAKKWGSYNTEGKTEKQIERYEDRILENWWNLISVNFFQLLHKENKPKKYSIYEIKRLSAETNPHFFDRDTMKFFGQRMSSFYCELIEDGRTKISAPMRDRDGRKIGMSVRYFNPKNNELELEAL